MPRKVKSTTKVKRKVNTNRNKNKIHISINVNSHNKKVQKKVPNLSQQSYIPRATTPSVSTHYFTPSHSGTHDTSLYATLLKDRDSELKKVKDEMKIFKDEVDRMKGATKADTKPKVDLVDGGLPDFIDSALSDIENKRYLNRSMPKPPATIYGNSLFNKLDNLDDRLNNIDKYLKPSPNKSNSDSLSGIARDYSRLNRQLQEEDDSILLNRLKNELDKLEDSLRRPLGELKHEEAGLPTRTELSPKTERRDSPRTNSLLANWATKGGGASSPLENWAEGTPTIGSPVSDLSDFEQEKKSLGGFNKPISARQLKSITIKAKGNQFVGNRRAVMNELKKYQDVNDNALEEEHARVVGKATKRNSTRATVLGNILKETLNRNVTDRRKDKHQGYGGLSDSSST